MNTELLKLLVELVIGAAVIMAIIALIAILTPKLARIIEKKHPSLASPAPERVDESKPEDYSVQGPYDPQKEDYDLNYKIYNKDIYGVDFKHGKK